MNEILKAVLSLSLSGSLLILLLFLLRPLFKERLSKRWQYYIWLVVVARLLLPFAPETNLMATLFQGIDRTIDQTEIVSPYTQQGGITDIPQTDDMENGQSNLHSRQTEPVELASNPVRNIVTAVWKNLWLGWLVVALILFIRKITVYQDFVKYIRAGCVEVAEIDLLERFGKLIERNKVKTTVELYTNNLISSPLLIGFFRPSIVLPSADLSPIDFEYTILHELTHFKRLDMFYKWLVQFSVCVHWFNPLVYMMGREVGRACELSCDETVIQALDLQGRRAYGDTLLNAMGAGGNYKNSLASVTLNESKELLKERLDAIMNFQKKSKFILICTTVLTVSLLACSFCIGAYAATVSPSSLLSEQDSDNKSISEKDGTALVNKYGNYGITYNSEQHAVYYDGKRVRQFVDGGAYYTGGGYWCDFYYTDNLGDLYLHVVRGERGEIKGIESLNDDMLSMLFGQGKPLNIKPNGNTDSSSKNAYQSFEKYGLTYSEQDDSVSLNGQPVKAFVDGGSKYKNGGYWFNIAFFNDSNSSNIYLASIRDKNGTIVGIEEMGQDKIEYYYGINGILATSSTRSDVNIESTDTLNETQRVFSSFNLPELPENTNKPGGYYFHNNDEMGVSAVTRWDNATGTFSLCDIFNNVAADQHINIAYEITVSKGTFNFTQSTPKGTSIIISEDIQDANIAYDYGVFGLDLSEGNNNFSFSCKDADISIRIVIMK